jgi:hypothetical protein
MKKIGMQKSGMQKIDNATPDDKDARIRTMCQYVVVCLGRRENKNDISELISNARNPFLGLLCVF